jgi:hypothetical protein
MARIGLTKTQVRETHDRLVAEGRYPSVDTVRHALGDVGSKSTIHRYLKELRDEDPQAGIRVEDTAGALQALVGQLAERLHAESDGRLRTLRAEHEAALRAKDAELAELRATVARLGARLQMLEEEAPWERRPQRKPALADGFGKFDGLLLNSRSAGRDASPFNMARSFARSELDLDTAWQGRGPLI